MKKPALLVLGAVLVIFISIYFIIPQKIQTTQTIKIDATDINVARFLVNKSNWEKWWPGKNINYSENIFTYKGVKYHIQNTTNSYVSMLVNSNAIELQSRLSYLADEAVSCVVTCTTEMQTSLNPFTQVTEYIKAKSIAKNTGEILKHFKSFMQKDVNVYGIKVGLKKVTDPVMLATQSNFTTYPLTEDAYKLIAGLKKQIRLQNAKETNKPMLNITKLGTNSYQMMAAIPIDKAINPNPGYFINNMVKGGNILVTEVKGGRYTIDNAFIQLKNYQKDHGLVSPAMPYELLITDRFAQKDTAKWVTQVYWPIF